MKYTEHESASEGAFPDHGGLFSLYPAPLAEALMYLSRERYHSQVRDLSCALALLQRARGLVSGSIAPARPLTKRELVVLSDTRRRFSLIRSLVDADGTVRSASLDAVACRLGDVLEVLIDTGLER